MSEKTNKKRKFFRHSTTYYRKKAKLLATDPNQDVPSQVEQDHQQLQGTQFFHDRITQPVENFTELSTNTAIACSSTSHHIQDPSSDDEKYWLESEHSDSDKSDNDWCLDDTESPSKSQDKLLCLQEPLKAWALRNAVPLKHLSELLEILTDAGIKYLPKDARTLLKTPKNVEIKRIEGGEIWYHGIENCLKNVELPDNILEVKLNFHFDGLPIGKSTKMQFWPILMEVINVPGVSSIFIVAVYSGESKPNSADVFLEDFVKELKLLLETGFQNIQGRRVNIKINALICDTPARSFIKCTVSHNAYHSCMKCIVQGLYDKGGRHISFPQTDCIRRTDADFRSKKYAEHHQIDKNTDHILVSPLEQLPIDMIDDVPVADSLHLIDLGIVKRCLTGWVRGSYNFKTKFFSTQINEISIWLKATNQFLPRDIHRSVRGLDHPSFWKASEYRTFLFYLGPMILKDHLSSESYKHFLLLFCAITLLSTNYYVTKENYVNVAHEMLVDYIEIFKSLHGEDSVSSNLHNLCHVAEDVRKFGCLPNISTYKFENELGKIGNLLRSGNQPLAQAAKRTIEKGPFSDQKPIKNQGENVTLKYPICDFFKRGYF